MGPRSIRGKQAPRGTLMQGFPKLHFEKRDATWTGFAGTEDSLRLKENALYVNRPSPSCLLARFFMVRTTGEPGDLSRGPTGNWVSSRG